MVDADLTNHRLLRLESRAGIKQSGGLAVLNVMYGEYERVLRRREFVEFVQEPLRGILFLVSVRSYRPSAAFCLLPSSEFLGLCRACVGRRRTVARRNRRRKQCFMPGMRLQFWMKAYYSEIFLSLGDDIIQEQ